MPMYHLQNLVQIVLKQQEIYDFILKMKILILMQVLLTLMILNLLSIRLNY